MKRIKDKLATVILTDAQVRAVYGFGDGREDATWVSPGIQVIVTHKSRNFPIYQAKRTDDKSETPNYGLFWTQQLDGDGL